MRIPVFSSVATQLISGSRRVWINQIFFALMEHGAVRVLDALVTIFLIRTLSSNDFGLFSIYQSWVAMALIFFPSIEVALFRDYSLLKKENRLAEELSVYRLFNFSKVGFLIIAILALSVFSSGASFLTRFSLIAFAFALPFSQSFYSYMREPLRFEMKQHIVAVISLVQRMCLLAILAAIAKLYPRNTAAMMFAAIFVYILAGFGWSIASSSLFKNATVWPSHPGRRIMTVFLKVVLWIHLGGVLTQTIQTFDIFSLNFFHADISEIGRYGIALKAANFFQLLPIALVSTFGVYLARNHTEAERSKEIPRMALYCGLFILLSAVLYFTGLIIAKPLLSFLAKGKLEGEFLERTIQYFRWQLAGVLILCAGYPLTTYLGIRGVLKKMFFFVMLPWLVITVLVYMVAANKSAFVLAQANVIVALANLVLNLIYFSCSFRNHHRSMNNLV